jgi:hypothetical protein
VGWDDMVKESEMIYGGVAVTVTACDGQIACDVPLDVEFSDDGKVKTRICGPIHLHGVYVSDKGGIFYVRPMTLREKLHVYVAMPTMRFATRITWKISKRLGWRVEGVKLALDKYWNKRERKGSPLLSEG